MKKLNYFLFSLFLTAIAGCESEAEPQKEVIAKGDDFNLQTAIELFKKSENPANFEKALNTESNFVNNLDLNKDGETDYVKVIDRVNGSSHSIVMQVAVNDKENQDIAAILVEKSGASNAKLQIVGNDVIYGKEVVFEPINAVEKKESNALFLASNATITVNVWAWPIIRHVYRVQYVPYVSPVRFEVYPNWYEPHKHHHGKGHAYGLHKNDHDSHYRPMETCELTNAHSIYITNRTNSNLVIVRFGQPIDTHHRGNDQEHEEHNGKHPGKGNEHHDEGKHKGEGNGNGFGNGHHKEDHDNDKHEKGPKIKIELNLNESKPMKSHGSSNKKNHDNDNDHGNDKGNGNGHGNDKGNGNGHGKKK